MPKPFKGKINLDIRDSTPDWSAFLADRAPEGAPNVLVVLYDDTGCAAWSPYGGRIEMPTLDRLAANGLTYAQWHTTALCSPTRSVFLTGRNHHQNGFASISETSTGFPGYNSHIPRENASMATVLRDAGWSTFWVGKNHNIPVDAWTMGSSKKDWPLGQGYDRFYGFIGGETNQWYPDLAEDNHYIDQPYRPEDGYHLSKDLADKALEFIRDSKQSEPDKPWYLWFCPGANHAPHHAPQEFIDKYKGKFDDGYEAYREWVLPRMIERGDPARGHRADADQPDDAGHVQRGRQRPPVGHAQRRREAAVLADGRGVRGLLGVHRPPGRADRRLPRGVRPARQHADPLRRRQRRLGRGHAERLGQREQVLQRLAGHDRGQPAADRQARRPRRLQPLPDRLGGRVLDALPDVQALLLPGRRRRPARDPLAGGDQGARRGARPVPPLHGHRPDDPRLLRRRDARGRRRSRADAAARRLHALQLRRGATRRRARRRSTTRCSARAASGTRAGRRSPSTGPSRSTAGGSTRTAGSSSTPTRTAPRRTTSPSSTPRSSRSSRRSGSRRPRSTTSSRSTTSASSSSARSSTRWPCRRAASTRTSPARPRSRRRRPRTRPTSRTRSSPRSSSPPTRRA